jgi:hypothetical protein
MENYTKISKKNEENFLDWSRDGRLMRHISAKSLINWIVVFPSKDKQVAMGLIDALLQVCKPFGKKSSLTFHSISIVIFSRNAS